MQASFTGKATDASQFSVTDFVQQIVCCLFVSWPMFLDPTCFVATVPLSHRLAGLRQQLKIAAHLVRVSKLSTMSAMKRPSRPKMPPLAPATAVQWSSKAALKKLPTSHSSTGFSSSLSSQGAGCRAAACCPASGVWTKEYVPWCPSPGRGAELEDCLRSIAKAGLFGPCMRESVIPIGVLQAVNLHVIH